MTTCMKIEEKNWEYFVRKLSGTISSEKPFYYAAALIGRIASLVRPFVRPTSRLPVRLFFKCTYETGKQKGT